MAQIITRNETNISLYALDDAKAVSIKADRTEIGDPVEFIIADCNASNVTLHTGVTTPEDWAGHKYFFDGVTWTLNPDWVDPATLEEL